MLDRSLLRLRMVSIRKLNFFSCGGRKSFALVTLSLFIKFLQPNTTLVDINDKMLSFIKSNQPYPIIIRNRRRKVLSVTTQPTRAELQCHHHAAAATAAAVP